jgi:hypothetical protein
MDTLLVILLVVVATALVILVWLRLPKSSLSRDTPTPSTSNGIVYLTPARQIVYEPQMLCVCGSQEFKRLVFRQNDYYRTCSQCDVFWRDEDLRNNLKGRDAFVALEPIVDTGLGELIDSFPRPPEVRKPGKYIYVFYWEPDYALVRRMAA